MDSTQDPGLVHVIDDDAGIRRAVCALLSANGLENRAYESADVFLRQYHDSGPACVVSDIRMPGITGLQLIERLRELGVHHPVIIMTAFSDVDTAVRCFRGGAADFFEKPVSGTVLLGRVHEALDRDRASCQLDAVRSRTLAGVQSLSPRERQVMDMLFAGMPNKSVAHDLNLSEKTVAAHRAHILEKMHAGSLTELVRALTVSEHEPELQPVAA